MSLGGAWNILRMPAFLVASPTGSAITGSFPYGGTVLGDARDLKVKFGAEAGMIVDEGFMDHLGAVMPSKRIVVACILRGWDKDAIGKVMLNSRTGTWNDKAVSEAPLTSGSSYERPGGILETKCFKLLVCPQDEERHPFVVLYNAMPVLDPEAFMAFERNEELGIAVGFHGLCDTDATARRFDIARKGSLTL